MISDSVMLNYQTEKIPVLAAENQDIVPHNYYTVSQRTPQTLTRPYPGPPRRCGIVLSLKFSWRRNYKAELQGVDCSGVQFLALPMITTMSNKDSSARMTGTFINFHSQFIFGCYSGEKRLVSTLRLVHHSHHEVSHSRRAGPSQPGPARPCQGLKVDMRIALRRRGGPSVLASSINIVHALFVYFLLIVAIICTIYRSTNFIYYWEICIFAPIIAKYF